MRTVLHLSDLHFGRVDPDLIAPLKRAVEGIKPDVVVVSGDLTQRARPEEFEAASEFLSSLPEPQIVVPGNHDVPLYNLFRRFVKPLARYKAHIDDDLEPTYVDDEIAIVGVNTARSFTLKGGRINEEQVARIKDKLCGVDGHVVKLLVSHHPFDMPGTWDADDLVGRARMAIEALAGCGVNIMLAGHIHMTHVGDTTTRYAIEGYSALVVQAGTATSTRGRGEPNSFNALRITGHEVRVECHTWDAAIGEFTLLQNEVFTRTANGWSRTAGVNTKS